MNELFYPRLLSQLSSVWFVCFHEFTFSTPHLLTDLISSVSQPASFSHTAAAAGSGRGRWVSLDVIQKHTRTHITTQARTQYGFPVIPWKITTSSNSDPNICHNKISLSVCVWAKMSRVSPLLISLLCSKAQSTLSHWGDLTRLTSQLYSHTPAPRSFSRSQKLRTHSAVLKRTGCNLEVAFQFLFQRENCGCKQSCRWQFHCWRQWRDNSWGRTAATDVRGGCVTRATQWRPAKLGALPRTAAHKFHQSTPAAAPATRPSCFDQRWPETQKLEFIHTKGEVRFCLLWGH